MSRAEATEALRHACVDSFPKLESRPELPELPEFPLSGDSRDGLEIPATASVDRFALWKSSRRCTAFWSANESTSWITPACCATA